MREPDERIERLRSICEDINHQRCKDGFNDLLEYRVGHGGELGLMAATEHFQPAAQIGNAENGATIVWFWEDGILEVRFRTSTPAPGQIVVMTVRGAAHPNGDFQVAETLNDLL